MGHRGIRDAPAEERDLARHGRVGRPETLCAKRARRTIPLGAAKVLGDTAIGHEIAPFAIQRFAGGADTPACRGIIREVTRLKERRRFLCPRFVMQRVGRVLVPILRRKSFVAAAQVIVGDQRRHLHAGELCQVRFTVIAGVGRDARLRGEQRLHGRHHRDQQRLLRTRAVGLCLDDDLMFVIDGGDAGIAPNHAVARRHLRTLVVRTIALAHGAFGSRTVIRMRGEPGAHLYRAPLLGAQRRGGGPRGLGFERAMHPLMPRILLRRGGLDQFGANAEL